MKSLPWREVRDWGRFAARSWFRPNLDGLNAVWARSAADKDAEGQDSVFSVYLGVNSMLN